MASTSSPLEDGAPTGGNEDGLQLLTSWYSNIPSICMDIHGDFAGSELFLVEGDTLVRHAITSAATEGAAVDMEGKESLWSCNTISGNLTNNVLYCLQTDGRFSTLLPLWKTFWQI